MLDFSTELALWQILLLALASFMVGLLGGFVGLALGSIRLPLVLLTGLDPRITAGTNILVSTLSSAAGGYRHRRERRVDWRAVAIIGGPSIVGALLGGLFSGVVSARLLIVVVGLLVAWQGWEFFGIRRRLYSGAQGGGDPPVQTEGPAATRKRGLAGGLGGLSIGVMGGAVGLILGSLRLPIMMRLLKMNPRVAAGSNMIIGAVMGVFGFVGHGIRSEVDLPLLLAMGLTGMAGSVIGARYTGRVSVSVLMLVLAYVLLVMGALLIAQGFFRDFD